MQNKNIVFIRNGYSTKNSGGDLHGRLLLNEIAKSNNVSIFLPYRDEITEYSDSVNKIHCSTLPLEDKFYGNNFLLMLIYVYRIFVSILFLRKDNSDLIIASSHLFHDIIPLFFIKNKSTKMATFVFHIIQEQNRAGLYGKFTSFLEKISFYVLKKRKTLVITDSNHVSRQLIEKYGFCKELIKTSTNGLDLGFIYGIKGEVNKESDLVFCGRLHKRKGVYDLVDIVDRVKKTNPHIFCKVIGDGPEKNNLIEAIKEKKLTRNFELVGFVSEEEKIRILKSGKIFVFPSYEEGWGIVIGEALACGLPVIVYDLKDIRDIWRDSVSWIDIGDKNSFANEIKRLLSNESEMQKRSELGVDFIKNMDWKRVLDAEIEILNNFCFNNSL